MIVSVDIGGTHLRVALLDGDFKILYRNRMPTGRRSKPESSCQQIVGMIHAGMENIGNRNIRGIGISSPSVDRRTGKLVNPPNLPEWNGYSISEFLGKRLGVATAILNDASLAALGEHRFGAGLGYQNMLYYTLSTGIGGGLIFDGMLYEGESGFAGELGHVTVNPGGDLCGCGNRGCLELYASGPSIVDKVLEEIRSGSKTSLSNKEFINTEDVFNAASIGDELCVEVVARAGNYLGMGILNAMHAFEPQVIVIGGGVSAKFSQLRPYVEDKISRYAMAHFRGTIDIKTSILGDDASLIGAACYADESISEE